MCPFDHLQGELQVKTQKRPSTDRRAFGGKRATLLKNSLSLGRNSVRPTPLQADDIFMPRCSDTS